MSAAEVIGSIDAATKLTRDLRAAASTLGRDEVRYLVDLYYQAQHNRITSANQIRSSEGEEPNEMLSWVLSNFNVVERGIRSAMDAYSMSTRPGRWMRSIHGCGPVLSAGFLAHLDVTKTETAGGFWRFAGLDPSVTWGKGQKRPWNATLKTLCWKQSDVWVKLRASDKDFYGQLYEQRKAKEVQRNERGDFAETARKTLESKKFRDSDTKKCYEAGLLPPGRIDLRARRWAVKLFLAHLHHVLYECEYDRQPPKPYIIEHGPAEHVHILGPPGWPCE